MEEVDANDNGIATHDGKARYAVTTTLASRVANLRPHWNDPEQDFDKGNLFRNIDNKNQDGEFQFVYGHFIRKPILFKIAVSELKGTI